MTEIHAPISMLQRYVRSFCTFALLLATSLAHAQIETASAESLLRKSGLWEQLAGMGPQVEAGMQQMLEQGGMTPGDGEKARVARVIRDAYAPSRMRSVSTRVIASGVKAQHLPALQAWYDSPVGRTIARLEEASATQVDPAATLAEGARLLKAMPADRRALLERLLEASDGTEAMVRITISTALAAHRGAVSAAPDTPGPSAAEVRATMEAQRPQMAKAFQAMMLASFAQVYASLPSGQLEQYVAFIRSPAGAQLNDVGLAALEAALTDAAAEMGRRLPGTRNSRNS